jgi:hypothetical protein
VPGHEYDNLPVKRDSLAPQVGLHYEARSWLSYYNESTPIGSVLIGTSGRLTRERICRCYTAAAPSGFKVRYEF